MGRRPPQLFSNLKNILLVRRRILSAVHSVARRLAADKTKQELSMRKHDRNGPENNRLGFALAVVAAIVMVVLIGLLLQGSGKL